MNDQGKASMVRGIALGLAGLGLAGLLAGCGGTGGVIDDPGVMAKPSNISFEITQDASDATLLLVDPEDGDAFLEAVKVPGSDGNKIIWRANFDFGIKFVQIDDPTKKPKKKFGPRQDDGWNTPMCNSNKTSCTLELALDPGTDNPKGKKEIRTAKYIVASPSGCTDTTPIPATCKYQDPIIIVRY
jgi:hypothetical protein